MNLEDFQMSRNNFKEILGDNFVKKKYSVEFGGLPSKSK